MENKRTKEAEGPLIAESNKLGGNFSTKGKAAFVKERYLHIYSEMICSQLLRKE